MIGQSISHYKILKKLGEGGMGVIYLAEDTILMRKVALKLLPPFLTADEDANDRFKKEAQLVASLNHPNIVTIYEINIYKGQHYLSLEFLEGESLREKLNSRKDKLSFGNIIDYSVQLCSGLSKAHSAGIIHMDIKPENIFITNDNIVKILDFGVSKLIGSSSIHDEKNILGTTAYMSPEQVNGEAIDNRTDIWTVGILIYEMVSGKLPFIGEYEQSIVYSILNEEPAPINTDIPSRLKKIVEKCLNKSKDGRYNSTEEILSGLKFIREKLTARPLLKSHETSELQNIIESLSNPAAQMYRPTDVFTGREDQLNVLRKKIEDTLNSRGSSIFVQGEAGIGKSQLVYQAIYNSVSANLNILFGRCLYDEPGFPYHPFAAAIKSAYSLTAGLEAQFIEALLKYAGKHGFNLTSSLPFIKSFLGFSGEHSSLLNKEQLWNAILMLYQAVSLEEPLILIIDDLQWSDKTTLGLFSFIARNCTKYPILLIGIHRPPEYTADSEKSEASPLLETIRQLKIEGLAELINLQRFNKEETELLLVKMLNSPVDHALVENIFQNTEGNPLFISELVKLMEDRKFIKAEGGIKRLENEIQPGKEMILTAKVQDVIHQRIDRLDSRLREILEVASCEGEEFEAEPLITCLDMDKITLLKNLSIIEKEHHLIRHEKNLYKFDHILIREVLYRNILFELRQEYHKLISEYLINKQGRNDELASKISYHLLESGNKEEAVSFLVLAANKARELYAVEDALKFYNQAAGNLSAADTDKIQLLMNIEEGLGDIYLLMGSTEKAFDKFQRFLDLAGESDIKLEEIKALRKVSEVYRIQGKIKDAFDHCKAAIQISQDIENKSELMNCLNVLAVIHAAKGEYNSTIELSKEALDLAKELIDLKSQSISFSNTGFAYWHLGIYISALEYFNHAIGIQRSIGDNLGLSTTLNFLGLVYLKLGEYENALSSSFESLNIKKNIGDIRNIPGTMNVIGDIYREVNDLERALEFHMRSLILAKEHQNKGAICDNLRDAGEDYFLMGDIKQALNYFEQALEIAKSSGIVWYETRTYISLSELFYTTGNRDKALHYSNLGLEYANKINAKELIIETLWNQAKVKAGSGNYDEIRKLYLISIELAESVGHKTFQWKLYKDFSRFLLNSGKNFEMNIYRNKSHDILKRIIGNLNEDLKRNFISSQRVKEVIQE